MRGRETNDQDRLALHLHVLVAAVVVGQARRLVDKSGADLGAALGRDKLDAVDAGGPVKGRGPAGVARDAHVVFSFEWLDA